ncbi:hypothetical protein INQ30_28235, partial [Escherichia coli]|nr:hypothetical protein [Escherichia coli]
RAAIKADELIQKDISIDKSTPREEKYAKFKLGEVDGFDVYEIPKGRTDLLQMSCDLGTRTQWCTASGGSNNVFKQYIKRGPCFIY